MYTTAFLDIPALERIGGTVRLPGSKSISNRLLLLAFLTELTTGEPTHIEGLLDSEDTQVMRTALTQLKAHNLQFSQGSAHGTLQFFLGNAGTAVRSLTAAMALLGVDCLIDGVARMRERPIADLVDALAGLGCNIEYIGNAGFLPLKIGKAALKLDVPIRVRGEVSSQFLTALLLTLPLVATRDIAVEVVGELISRPYVTITLELLKQFGIEVQQQGWRRFSIAAGARYVSPKTVVVEADASSASYFMALGGLAATEDAPLRIEGVGAQCIQGDIAFAQAAQRMGVCIKTEPRALTVWRENWGEPLGFLHALDMDCNHMPDAAMTLAVLALYAKGTTVLRNIASWRVKETDRIAAMATELRKLGATVEEAPDCIAITPPEGLPAWRSAAIETYDDHRMAMCFALAAFNPAGARVRIHNPQCVSKTYPEYFETLFAVASATPASIPVICVDGPTASGKGTLAAALAQRLGYHYLDSGALYRLVGFAAMQAQISLDDEQALGMIAAEIVPRFEGDRVWLNMQGQWCNVSVAIRAEEVGMAASRVAAYPRVREALIALQRRSRALPGLVADGRDMGTVIFADAALKIFLTATAAARAQRRYEQLRARGVCVSIEALCADLETRDRRDQNRPSAPLVAAKDAIELDNTMLSVDQSVEQVLAWWAQKNPF